MHGHALQQAVNPDQDVAK